MLIKVLVAFSVVVGTVSCLPETRVVNGLKAEKYKYPFMVSLRVQNEHNCGGSIIATKWILTAAHCVESINSSKLTVQYGVTEISEEGPTVVPVKQIIYHNEYNLSNANANDIALLELETTLIYNYRSVAPINLPEKNFEIAQVPQGESGFLAGWGSEMLFGPSQTNLQVVELKIYSDEECYQRHEGRTTSNHICAGVDEGGKGQCTDDSGGPLIYKGNTQLGIVSWSRKPCAVYPYPGVYTKVSHYIDWIHSQMNEPTEPAL